MKRTLITPNLSDFPSVYHSLMEGVAVFDSSCSPEARVLCIQKGEGVYLKSGAAGTLEREAAMTRFYHARGLGTEVLDYRTEDGQDWLLTVRVRGEDCTHAEYLSDPKRLARTTGTLLRALHEISPAACPVTDRTNFRYWRNLL